MKTLQETIDSNFKDPMYHAIISEYAKTIDELEGLEISDIALQRAHGNEDVIYYNKAHELIRRVSSEVRYEAEQMAKDAGGYEGKSYDEIACSIALWITYQEFYNQMMTEVQELISVVEQYIEETEQEAVDYEDQELIFEQYQEQISLAEDLLTALEDK